MPRLTQAVPKYRKHRATGLAVVTIAGHDHYLGSYGSKSSRMLYDRLIAEFLASGRQPSALADEVGVTVVEILAAFWKHAKTYYSKNGQPTQEQKAYRVIIRDMKSLYGDVEAIEFGPKALKAVRHVWLERGQKRSTINSNSRKLLRIFRWAVAEEMIPPVVYEALRAVPGLRKGRTTAPESDRVQPVSQEVIERSIGFMQPIISDMVRIQLLTGMRPSEVCNLRSSDVERSDEVWTYRPFTHKTDHHNQDRLIFFGPEAQSVLAKYLLRNANDFCFSPQESVCDWLETKRAGRTTVGSQGNRPGTNRKQNPQRSPGGQYTTNSYRRAIHRACDRAFPPPERLAKRPDETTSQWHKRLGPAGIAELKQWQSEHRWSPNQLRHTAATRIRREFGLEAAQVVLGHTVADVTQIYAERDTEKARDVARKIG